MRALREVSSDIAHDLKTPLQRVAVHLDDLQAQMDGDPQSALLARTRAEVDEMARVFHALLQLAQVEAGSPRARFEPVDLAEVCRTVVEVFEPMAAEKGQVLGLTLHAPHVTIEGERALLGQMLSNLIENALRHTPEGARIGVTLGIENGAVTLSVADTGPGIPEAERDKVRQRLYRLDRSRHTPGHGLGLSLVDAVAALHGATLTLSDNAPGLRATVTFPA